MGADAHVYSGSVALAATEHSHLCRGSVDGMLTDGPRLLVAGVALAERTFRKACAAFGWTSQSLSEVVTHQVSALHSTRLAAALGLDLTRMLGLYPEHGNVGPASLPMVLARAAELRRGFARFAISHVRRAANAEADRLIKEAIADAAREAEKRRREGRLH